MSPSGTQQSAGATQFVWLAATIALALVALAVVGAARASAIRETRLPLDDRRLAAALLAGFHEPEQDGRGGYRWATGDARAWIAHPWAGVATAFVLGAGPGVPGGPTELTLAFGATPPVTIALAPEPRRYRLLVPPGASRLGSLLVGLRSATATLPPDIRALGVRVEELAARSLGGAVIWPAPGLLLMQGAMLALVGLMAWRVGAPAPGAAVAMLAVACLLALPPLFAPLVAPLYLWRLAAGVVLLAAATLVGLPWLERAWGAGARAIWVAMLLACGLRLTGALYPPFAAYDLGLNLGRLAATVGGTLVATNESFEFGGGLTVYPSGPYVVLMPGLLAGLTPKLAVQGGIALLDGLATLGVAALGRALGVRGPALLFACLAYAAAPISLTTLYYGHTAQAFGQALMAPLAAVLLLGLGNGGRWWPWLLAWALLSAALLSHIGVSILAGAWLGLAWLALTVRRTLDGPTWWRLTVALGAGGLTGLVLVYGPVVLAHLEILAGLEFGGEGVAPKPSYNLIVRAPWLAYGPVGVALALVALPLVRQARLPRGGAELLAAWAGAAGLFLGVELLTGLQVRYLVFLTPLICLLVGLALGRLALWRPVGAWAAWSLVLALLAHGAWGWLAGALARVAPSMVPLLR